MTNLNELSATAIVAAITSNNCTAENVTRACLARIEEREAEGKYLMRYLGYQFLLIVHHSLYVKTEQFGLR